MRTLLTSLRVGNLDASVEFYGRLGFDELGRVTSPDGSTLVMLCLPGDGDMATLELGYDEDVDSYDVGNGFSHLAISVDDIEATVAHLEEHGAHPEKPPFQPEEASPWICVFPDPDGYRIEVVQFAAGEPEGITREMFEQG